MEKAREQVREVGIVEQTIREFADAGMFRPMPLRSYKRMVEEREAGNRSAVELGVVDGEDEPLIF